MSTNLYEVLEIQADATPEQIRKAYKKRALQTHPDRAPASDKAQAEERFRQVNNAYEVLNDPQKRQSYDRHGVWPPPAEDLPRPTQNTTRSHPFRPNVFAFTDPFELFDSIFGHGGPFHDQFPFGPSRAFPDPFPTPVGFMSPVDHFAPFVSFNPGAGIVHDVYTHNAFLPSMVPMMGGGLFQPQVIGPDPPSTSSRSSRQGMGGGRWISESRSTSIVNGLATSVHERVDPVGNVHTTTTHPDGRQTYTINGVHQPSGHIEAPHAHHSRPAGPPRRHHHHHHHRDHLRGGHDRHGAYRNDRDYFPDYRDPRHPSA